MLRNLGIVRRKARTVQGGGRRINPRTQYTTRDYERGIYTWPGTMKILGNVLGQAHARWPLLVYLWASLMILGLCVAFGYAAVRVKR